MADDKRMVAALKAGISREEAEAMFADDKLIDKGQVMEWDLPPDEHKKAMKYANSDEKKRKAPTAYKFDTSTKKRKENPTKAGIIAEIASFLMENSGFSPEKVEITNKERMIAFQIGENSFELTLVQKRKPKN